MTTDYGQPPRDINWPPDPVLLAADFAAALDKVDQDTQQRIVRYLVDRYGGEK